MADKKNERRRRERNHHAAADTQLPPEFQIKEYNYILHVDADDGNLLQTHREQLAAGTVDFAEVYYNFLFDNPDIADVLYSFERNGGDVGGGHGGHAIHLRITTVLDVQAGYIEGWTEMPSMLCNKIASASFRDPIHVHNLMICLAIPRLVFPY